MEVQTIFTLGNLQGFSLHVLLHSLVQYSVDANSQAICKCHACRYEISISCILVCFVIHSFSFFFSFSKFSSICAQRAVRAYATYTVGHKIQVNNSYKQNTQTQVWSDDLVYNHAINYFSCLFILLFVIHQRIFTGSSRNTSHHRCSKGDTPFSSWAGLYNLS